MDALHLPQLLPTDTHKRTKSANKRAKKVKNTPSRRQAQLTWMPHLILPTTQAQQGDSGDRERALSERG
ncbi:hypothetical protein A4R35_09660 [Thermogemmatispora tikiterensis]|uniref:Uncharacterized protein n=1 Tax=Thermogemmatispora tikiterensis TaxID=1825093 RepID=A0A328VG37_9CHLR|nr:hypothetical protein A4R35_09660 [Thermogemmatispora tikiterensis]